MAFSIERYTADRTRSHSLGALVQNFQEFFSFPHRKEYEYLLRQPPPDPFMEEFSRFFSCLPY